MQIGWIGLGTMGASMAGHLVQAGHGVTVFNRTPGRAEAVVAAGAREAATPAAAATGAELVFACVSDSPDVEAIVLGADGVAGAMAAGSVFVDCSTISPTVARRLAVALRERGIGAVDAPVSGGSEGAAKGTLTTFVGGEDADVERATPALRTFCARLTHLGGPGSGQAGKAVNQTLLAGAYAALGEALVLGEKEGLPLPALAEALGGGAARSWVLENRAGNVIADRYPLGFKASLYLKDLRIALAEAEDLGLELPVTRLVAGLSERIVRAGYGDEDVSNFARLVRGDVP